MSKIKTTNIYSTTNSSAPTIYRIGILMLDPNEVGKEELPSVDDESTQLLTRFSETAIKCFNKVKKIASYKVEVTDEMLKLYSDQLNSISSEFTDDEIEKITVLLPATVFNVMCNGSTIADQADIITFLYAKILSRQKIIGRKLSLSELKDMLVPVWSIQYGENWPTYDANGKISLANVSYERIRFREISSNIYMMMMTGNNLDINVKLNENDFLVVSSENSESKYIPGEALESFDTYLDVLNLIIFTFIGSLGEIRLKYSEAVREHNPVVIDQLVTYLEMKNSERK